jgi:hypothetical protein
MPPWTENLRSRRVALNSLGGSDEGAGHYLGGK